MLLGPLGGAVCKFVTAEFDDIAMGLVKVVSENQLIGVANGTGDCRW